MHEQGILDKYNVEMIGAKPDAIDKAENRERFNQAMAKIGLNVAKNTVVNNLDKALAELSNIGLPAVIRPSFTLGGTGGGIAHTKEEYRTIVAEGLRLSPTNEVLIDESILGWKEYEMEVIRDKADNVIIICSIENVDPMGVHTGDSITVAPAQTLTDKEYQYMRNASIAVLREIGVETGGSNVQFAVNPADGKVIVIEMNPRVSRSSALASKATGFPIAKIAAKLAVGFTLDELKNDITRDTPASFEPSIDYIVTKIPRFTFEKFNIDNPTLSTAMRSVGEGMAIGRSFTESLQKGLRSMETGLLGLDEPIIKGISSTQSLEQQQQIIKQALRKASPDRLLIIAHALRCNISVETVCDITKYDPWFIREIHSIVEAEKEVQELGLPNEAYDLLQLKKLGFSDAKLAQLSNCNEEDVYKLRHALQVRPVYKMIDTCAAEFASFTPYMYSCYEGDGITQPDCESNPLDKRKVVILGSGPNRIGQGIEFDYSCTHAATSLSAAGYETIMINCNPETVSTDYDTADRLYFEPLTGEDITEILHTENATGEISGTIVKLGGQTPLKLSSQIEKMGFKIAGTPTDSLDIAEDRERFKALLDKLDLRQPDNTVCYTIDQVKPKIEQVGFPVVIRPSNVLGGRAMATLNNDTELQEYLKNNANFIIDGAILIDKFLEGAIEIDVDLLADGQDTYIAGIMEHIEYAGVHSGDSACSIPTVNVSAAMLEEIKSSSIKLAKQLSIIGLMNIQYAIQDETLYVLEVNPRASRSVPFVAKATGVPIANIASRIMLGEKLAQFNLPNQAPEHFSIKEVVFPFARFEGVDIKLGPEMQSTGEVMGIDHSFPMAFYKAQLAAGYDLAKVKNAYVDFHPRYANQMSKLITIMQRNNINIFTNPKNAKYLNGSNNHITILGYPETIKEIESSKIQLLLDIDSVNTDSSKIRKLAFSYKIPYATTFEGAKVTLASLEHIQTNTKLNVQAIQDYPVHY